MVVVGEVASAVPGSSILLALPFLAIRRGLCQPCVERGGDDGASEVNTGACSSSQR